MSPPESSTGRSSWWNESEPIPAGHVLVWRSTLIPKPGHPGWVDQDVHRRKGVQRWVDPQLMAAQLLPRPVRPSRPERLTTAGRARMGRRTAPSRAGPDDDDPEPAAVGPDGAGGRA